MVLDHALDLCSERWALVLLELGDHRLLHLHACKLASKEPLGEVVPVQRCKVVFVVQIVEHVHGALEPLLDAVLVQLLRALLALEEGVAISHQEVRVRVLGRCSLVHKALEGVPHGLMEVEVVAEKLLHTLLGLPVECNHGNDHRWVCCGLLLPFRLQALHFGLSGLEQSHPLVMHELFEQHGHGCLLVFHALAGEEAEHARKVVVSLLHKHGVHATICAVDEVCLGHRKEDFLDTEE
mmetsp:Transcript_23892/g.70027  ORF Transcript_23892/g.70027 Transcript_23892/m.70027 type:complete len:238 (-) Transcript_23892:1021-1734(-)